VAISAAIRTGVKSVVALSTDKAANPINLYGASKLASDKIFSAAINLVGERGTPLFTIVRYGNVIGSRGSVVPFFQRLINSGAKSLPITDMKMTRFWITLENGGDFVLSSMQLMQGGEIFVPKIPSMKIVDLAATMAPDLDTHVVGIRAGEKLHEVMITEDDARSTIELHDRYVIRPAVDGLDRVYHPVQKLVPDMFRYDSNTNAVWLGADEMRRMIAEVNSP